MSNTTHTHSFDHYFLSFTPSLQLHAINQEWDIFLHFLSSDIYLEMSCRSLSYTDDFWEDQMYAMEFAVILLHVFYVCLVNKYIIHCAILKFVSQHILFQTNSLMRNYLGHGDIP